MQKARANHRWKKAVQYYILDIFAGHGWMGWKYMHTHQLVMNPVEKELGVWPSGMGINIWSVWVRLFCRADRHVEKKVGADTEASF